MTQEWGELTHRDLWVHNILVFWEPTTYPDFWRTSHVVFKAGKNWDGYFDNNNLVKHVELSMDIFKEKTHRFKKALFLFDNVITHPYKMLKSPKLGWTPCLGGPKMWDTVLPDGSIQSFYFPDDHLSMLGWFKGMKVVLEERGLWQLRENGKQDNKECKEFKCPEASTTCCCCCILFNHISKRSLPHVATYVIFTPNLTAN
jgi:hypothetical protein